MTPSSDNPFAITGIQAEKGTHIRWELSEIRKGDDITYQLSIYNTKQAPGWYVDHVFVKTDSRITPEFKISVLGVIREGS